MRVAPTGVTSVRLPRKAEAQFDSELLAMYDPVTGEQGGNPNPIASWAGGPLTLRSIREILADVATARSQDDPALVYLDGLELFGEADLHNLADGLHPNTEGYLAMAERFAQSPTVRQWMELAR